MQDKNEAEINLRINVPKDLHEKVIQVQGLLTYKEKKKPFIHETYKRLLEIGISQFMKQNR